MTNFQQSHWFLTDIVITYGVDSFTVVATTDVPCHLFLRETLHPPRKHPKPSPRRGLYQIGDIRFCFVVYYDKPQDEDGDTLIHTWAAYSLNPCHPLYFYLFGTIIDIPSVSESPIFTVHREAILYAPLISEPWTCNFVASPPVAQILSEAWTCNFIAPPGLALLVDEPWTCGPVSPPDMIIEVNELWSS